MNTPLQLPGLAPAASMPAQPAHGRSPATGGEAPQGSFAKILQTAKGDDPALAADRLDLPAARKALAEALAPQGHGSPLPAALNASDDAAESMNLAALAEQLLGAERAEQLSGEIAALSDALSDEGGADILARLEQALTAVMQGQMANGRSDSAASMNPEQLAALTPEQAAAALMQAAAGRPMNEAEPVTREAVPAQGDNALLRQARQSAPTSTDPELTLADAAQRRTAEDAMAARTLERSANTARAADPGIQSAVADEAGRAHQGADKSFNAQLNRAPETTAPLPTAEPAPVRAAETPMSTTGIGSNALASLTETGAGNPTSSLNGSANPSANGQLTAQLATPQWRQELGQQMASMVRHGDQSISLRLNPAELGPLVVDMKVTDQQAQLQFLSGHQQVRSAIEQALPQLREALAEQGISLGETNVGEQREGRQSLARDGRGDGAPGGMGGEAAGDLDAEGAETTALESDGTELSASGVNLYV